MSDDTRFHPRDRTQPERGDAETSGSGRPDLAEIRERAERLRHLGSGIIENALSGNSERFLAHSRQQGGQ